MKTYLGAGIVGLGVLAAMGATRAPPPITLMPESRIWVEGTSTVRSFSCRATQVEGRITPGAGESSLAIGDLGRTVAGAVLTIPVEALDCGNGTMNGHMRRALRAGEHPSIQFVLEAHEVTPTATAEGTVRMTGRLRIAGQERSTALEGIARHRSDGSLQVVGRKELKMTDFGVNPPTLMLGTLKVRDPVLVHFDLRLEP